jgi:A118 family predicted phage portal protein
MMGIYDYQEAFGAWDRTSVAMRRAIDDWFGMYYQSAASADSDPCQRIPFTIVNKLVRTIFGEYKASAESPAVLAMVEALDRQRKQAMQLALIGGECYIKPCPEENGFSFTLIPRNNVLIFGRDGNGVPTDMGTVEKSVRGKYYYTLLERRTVDGKGYLTIENRLFRSSSAQALGTQVALAENPAYAALAQKYRYPVPIGSLGLVCMKTPMVNCVDGSPDGVAVFAPAVGLIRNIDRNEAQMNGEFSRGESRIIASSDLLNKNSFGSRELTENLFVGLDEDPEQVGLTIFSPKLREQSFLARKQEYLRNVESVIGLRRGMLSDANVEERTATEIASSAGDYNLTVIDFQDMWVCAVQQAVEICCALARIYRQNVPESTQVSIDWGNGVLYDEDKIWEAYRGMVTAGLLKPEIALGWRFNMPTDTEAELAAIRQKYMPTGAQ